MTATNRFSSNAFTVIEMLAVIVIIALAGALAAFLMYPRMESTALRTAASQLMLACRYAKLTAAQHAQLCQLQLDRDKGEIQLQIIRSGIPVATDDTTSETPSYSPSNDYHPFMLSSPVRFGQILIDGQPADTSEKIVISFYPDGAAQPAAIQIQTPDDALFVTIDRHSAKARLHAGPLPSSLTTELPIDSSLHYE